MIIYVPDGAHYIGCPIVCWNLCLTVLSKDWLNFDPLFGNTGNTPVYLLNYGCF